MKPSVLRGALMFTVLGGIWLCVAFEIVWPMPLIVIAGSVLDGWLLDSAETTR